MRPIFGTLQPTSTFKSGCGGRLPAPDTPEIVVEIDRCLVVDDEYYENLAKQFSAVPMPDFAAPADGDDAEMTVYQPSSDTLWEFWKLRKNGGTWRACWGGRWDGVSKSDGIFPFPFGTTATGLPLSGGQITAEELKAGAIKHVMGIALVEAACKSSLSWPAKRSDGESCDSAICIPEGIRFRLDPAVKVEQLDMHHIGKVIAKAAQTYGFVVWDKAATTSLRAKNPKSYTQLGGDDPYDALFAPQDQWSVLDGFPWDKIQFLPMDYGKPAGE